MLTPLSIQPYNSRFTLDIDLADKIYVNTYEYVNMVYHGFYGGTSLQSQELNELQENIQNQLSLANILSGNWLEYPKTTIPTDITPYDLIFPIDPYGMSFDTSAVVNNLNLTKGYYLYSTDYGNMVFVNIPNRILGAYTDISRRTVSGLQTEWDILLDDNGNDPYNDIGAKRIQLFLKEETSQQLTYGTSVISDSDISINPVIFYTKSETDEIHSFSGFHPTDLAQQTLGRGVLSIDGTDLTPPPGITGVKQICQGFGWVVALTEKNGVQGITSWGNNADIGKQIDYFFKQLEWYKDHTVSPVTYRKNLSTVKIKKISTGSNNIAILLDNGEIYVIGDNSTTNLSDENTVFSDIGSIPRPVFNDAAWITGFTGYIVHEYGQSMSSYLTNTPSISEGCFTSNVEYNIPWTSDQNWRQYRGNRPNCGRDLNTDSPSSWLDITGAPNDYQFSRSSVGHSGANYTPGSAWYKNHNDQVPNTAPDYRPDGYIRSAYLPKDIKDVNIHNSIFGNSPKRYKDVKCGRSHILALTEEGTIETWGWNWYYMCTGSGPHPVGFLREGSGVTLGNLNSAGWQTTNDEGSIVNRPFPKVPTGENSAIRVKKYKTEPGSVKAIGTGYYTSAVIGSTGELFVWDRNEWGESTDGFESDGITPKGLPKGPFKEVRGGYHHSIALRENGTVVCWGENNDQECNVPQVLTNVDTAKCVWVRAGRRISFALQQDGTLWGWGNTKEKTFGFKGFTDVFNDNTNKIKPAKIVGLSGPSQIDQWCNAVSDEISDVPNNMKFRRGITFSYKPNRGITWGGIPIGIINTITNSKDPLSLTYGPSTTPNHQPEKYHPQHFTRVFDFAGISAAGGYPGLDPLDYMAMFLINGGCTAAGMTKLLSEMDTSMGYYLRSELPKLVLSLIPPAATFPGDIISKIKDIFTEITKYTDVPNGTIQFQRKGYTIGQADTNRCTSNFIEEDGSYLGNNWTSEPIATSLSILNEIDYNYSMISQDLINKLKLALKYDTYNIVRNWKDKLAWYTHGTISGLNTRGQPNTNQWIEPVCAMIRNSLIIQDQNLLPVYNLGVTLLLSSKVAFNNDGSFSEGFAYSEQVLYTLFPLFIVLSQIEGEDRISEFKFFIDNFWKWNLDHLLPGNYLVNYGDSRSNRIYDWAITAPPPTIQYAVGTAGSTAAKNYKYLYPNSSTTDIDLASISYRNEISGVGATLTIENWNYYDISNLVVWRSERQLPIDIKNNTGSTASFAIWAKGSTLTEGHKHRDEGQFSIYCGNRIVILESGIDYDISQSRQDNMRGPIGHNILQYKNKSIINEKSTHCPMTINRLNNNGGDISIDVSDAYLYPFQNVSRGITWGTENNNKTLRTTITDTIKREQYTAITQNTLLLRFHTGYTSGDLTITNQQITWPGTTMTCVMKNKTNNANIALSISGSTAENATYKLQDTSGEAAITIHKVINIKNTTGIPVSNLDNELITTILTSRLVTDQL